MCADRESRELHEKRLAQKNGSRTTRVIDKFMRTGRAQVRGKIHVSTALAAVAADVIDALDPDELVTLKHRDPRFSSVALPEPQVFTAGRRHAQEAVQRQRLVDERDAQVFNGQVVYANLSAA